MEDKKKVVGKLDMKEVEEPILAVLEHIVDTYNLIYHTRGISEGLPLRLGHLINGEFTDVEGRQHIFHAMPKYDCGMLLHILSVYTESNIVGDDEPIEEGDDTPDEWMPEAGIGIDTDIKTEED